jgi:hypothetical protein
VCKSDKEKATTAAVIQFVCLFIVYLLFFFTKLLDLYKDFHKSDES